MLDAQALDPFLGGDTLVPDPGLLLGEQVLAHLVCIVGLEQLSFLLVEARQPPFGLRDVLSGQLRNRLDVGGYRRPQTLALLAREFLGSVVLLDGGLDRLDAMGALFAVAVLASATDEVFVGAALAFGTVVDQPAATLAAVDGAAQVVEVPPGAFAADALGGQQFLDLLERGLVHQRLVAALVDLAAIRHLAQVVDVAEQRLEILGLERPRRVLPGRAGAQAALLHDGGQLSERVVAGGVEREGFANQRGALRVEYDRADFAAVHHQAVVQVADGGAVGSAAALGLLGRALHDLGCQVAAVELRDGRHDAVQQQAGRCLVDVLGDGDELGSGLADCHDYLNVIGSVPGQAVNLVDDHVVKIAASQPLQHGAECRTLGGLGGLSPVHVLVYDLSAELVGLALAGFTLGRDREALGVEILVGLLGGRDTQVDNRSLVGLDFLG